MAAPLGWFDPQLRDDAWAEPIFVVEGWFDRRLIDTEGAPPAPTLKGGVFESIIFGSWLALIGVGWKAVSYYA